MSDHLQDSEESMLPKTTKNGWLYIYLVVAALAITAVILGQLYRDTTKPGVQNPHWEPLHSTIAACTGCSVSAPAESPSTVTIWQSRRLPSGQIQALTVL